MIKTANASMPVNLASRVKTALSPERAGLWPALGLAFAASFASWQWMTSAVPRSVSVVRISSARPAGYMLSRADLSRFELADVSDRTTESVVAWRDADDLVGKTLDRALPASALVLWSDIRFETNPLRPGEDGVVVSLDSVAHNMKWLRVGSSVTFEIARHEPASREDKLAATVARVGPLRIAAVSPDGYGDHVMVAVPASSSDENLALLRRATARNSGGPHLRSLIVHRSEDDPSPQPEPDR